MTFRAVCRFTQLNLPSLLNFSHTNVLNPSMSGNVHMMQTRSKREMMESKMNTFSGLEVKHDKDQKEFYIRLGKESTEDPKAVLQYEWIQKNCVDLYHTGVPEVFRGKGVAKLLAEAALEHFASKDITMRLSCTYLQYHIEKNKISANILEKIENTS